MNPQDLINRARQQRTSYGPQPTVEAITNSTVGMDQIGASAQPMEQAYNRSMQVLPQATVPQQYIGYGGSGGISTPGGRPAPGYGANLYGDMVINGQQGNYGQPTDTRMGPVNNPMQGNLSNIYQRTGNMFQAGGPVRQKVSNANVGRGGQPLFGQNLYQPPKQSSGGGSDPYADLNYYAREGDWVQLGSAADIPGADPNGMYTTQVIWYNPKTGETSGGPPSAQQPGMHYAQPVGGGLVDPTFTPYPPVTTPENNYNPQAPGGIYYDQGPVVNGKPSLYNTNYPYIL